MLPVAPMGAGKTSEAGAFQVRLDAVALKEAEAEEEEEEEVGPVSRIMLGISVSRALDVLRVGKPVGKVMAVLAPNRR